MGTTAPIRRTTNEPKRVGNPFYQPLRAAPIEKPDEVAPARPPGVAPPEKVPA